MCCLLACLTRLSSHSLDSTATPQGLIAQHITRFNISNGQDIPADATLSKSQRALLASMCDDALQAKPHDMKLMVLGCWQT